MTKHGCFSLALSDVENLIGNAIRQKPLRLLINVAIAASMIFLTSGCANVAKGNSRSDRRLSKAEVLERKLRRAQAKIETLRERNLILKSRIKMISRSGGVEPLGAKEDLRGFDNGVVLDVPIDARRERIEEPSRQSVATLGVTSSGREEVLNRIDLRPRNRSSARKETRTEVRTAERLQKIPSQPQRLPAKKISQPAAKQTAKQTSMAAASSLSDSSRGEQADRALVRSIVAMLKEQDFSEAERTAVLLEKSYPDSSALAEAKFQIGLAYYRERTKVSGALQKADGFFAESLGHAAGHVRVKAGASLMRGIIAKQMGAPSGDRRNLEIASKNFMYVISTFPKTSEARRARAELSAMNRRIK